MGQKMRLMMILLVIFLGRGTSAQSESCPQIQCPVCTTNEKQVSVTNIFTGCPLCICEACPQPFCVCTDGLTSVLQTRENECPTCGCELCPEIGCPVCESYEKPVYGTDEKGCSTCSCECVQGTTWKDGCNTCTCVSDGVVGCTLKACADPCPQPFCVCTDGLTPVLHHRENECPICGCEECPEIGCPVCESYEKQLYGTDENGCSFCTCECVQGTTWKDDCNTCTCFSDGFVGCTLIACAEQCPEIQCPVCEAYEKEVTVTNISGCLSCICEVCPQPDCVCTDGLTPVLQPRENECPTCGCECPDIGCPICSTDEKEAFGTENGCLVCFCEPCPPPAPCDCLLGFDQVDTIQPDGCPGCDCIPSPQFVVEPEPCPPCDCSLGFDQVDTIQPDGCPECDCIPSPQCFPAVCGCAPGFDTVDTVQPDGCPGCECVPAPCPQPLCECTDGLTPVLIELEDECPTCSCVTAPCANDGESCGAQCTCRTVCEEGEYEDGLCPTDLQDVGQCSKCKTCPQPDCVCTDGLIPVLQSQENGCPTCGCACATDPVCLFGCQGDQVFSSTLGPDGCLECQCVSAS